MLTCNNHHIISHPITFFKNIPGQDEGNVLKPGQLKGSHGALVLACKVGASSLEDGAADDLLAISRFGVGFDSVDLKVSCVLWVVLCAVCCVMCAVWCVLYGVCCVEVDSVATKLRRFLRFIWQLINYFNLKQNQIRPSRLFDWRTRELRAIYG